MHNFLMVICEGYNKKIQVLNLMTVLAIDKNKLNKMALVCAAELRAPSYMPSPSSPLTIKVRLKFLIKKALGLSVRRPDYSYFWTTAVLADGLAEYINVDNDKFFISELKQFHKESKRKASFKNITYVDEVMHGNSLIDLYNREPSAWMKADADDLAHFLLESHTKTLSGILPYRQQNKNSVLVDTLGMVCPFLTKYGVVFNCQPAVALATKQLREFIDKGISSDLDLPYHGYSYIPEKNLGGDGWGRGLGWFLLGIIGVLEFLPRNDVNYQFFLSFYRSLIEQVFNKQGKSGAFSVQLLDEGSTPDSGATGMIAYACAKGVELNLIDKTYLERCAKAFEFILSVTDEEGRVQECSGEALGANNYSNKKGWYPWGQGPSVSLGACLLRQV